MAKNEFIEISDKKTGKIKIEINKFLEEMIKQLAKNSPEKLKTLREEIDEIIKNETERKQEEKPRIGEYFKDAFGRSFIVTSKNTLKEEPTVRLRRGLSEWDVSFKDLYNKDGTKKNISEDILKENEVEVLF